MICYKATRLFEIGFHP